MMCDSRRMGWYHVDTAITAEPVASGAHPPGPTCFVLGFGRPGGMLMRGDEWLLFGHLIGVIVLFGAVAIENATLVSVLRARTVDDLRGATTFVPLLSRLFPIAVVLILGFGIGLV